MASTAPSIKIVKQGLYRGQTKIWSNRYHFTNNIPADATKWGAFADAITAAEKLIYPSSTGHTITGAFGYDAGSDVPVYSKTYSLAGTGTFTSSVNMPGDVAALVRYSTSARTSKNHALYLFNYYHTPQGYAGGTPDQLNPSQLTAYGTYAAAWVAGFSDGSVTHKRCGPRGDLATGYVVNAFLRHRDFPSG